jgi:hypothetical protein
MTQPPCDLTRVHERLDDLFRETLAVREAIGGLTQRLDALAKTVDSHHTTLHGNGQAGMVTRVVTLEESRPSIKALLAMLATVVGVAASVGAVIAEVLR